MEALYSFRLQEQFPAFRYCVHLIMLWYFGTFTIENLLTEWGSQISLNIPGQSLLKLNNRPFVLRLTDFHHAPLS